jgi:RNA polymerase-binding transcription factor DksA
LSTPLQDIAHRRDEVRERLASIDDRLKDVRVARGDSLDEEHDPEGFTLTFEWQQAEGARREHLSELAELDDAEARVAAGTYGVCVRCGSKIPAGQLHLRPARTTCVSCTR